MGRGGRRRTRAPVRARSVRRDAGQRLEPGGRPRGNAPGRVVQKGPRDGREAAQARAKEQMNALLSRDPRGSVELRKQSSLAWDRAVTLSRIDDAYARGEYEQVVELIDALNKKLNISKGETSPDGQYTIIPSECLGACDRAPVCIVGEKVVGPVKADELNKILDEASHA